MTISKDQIKQMDAAGEIVRNYDNPLLKDTIMMPDGGYVIVRFKAENPGIVRLLFHRTCFVI